MQVQCEKTDAIRNMPASENQAALQRFLGMTNYLNKFIKDYSEKTATLRELLHNDVVWNWTETHQQAFDRLKDYLTNPPVPKFFDAGKLVLLSVDGSKSGLFPMQKPDMHRSERNSRSESDPGFVFSIQVTNKIIYQSNVISNVSVGHEPILILIDQRRKNDF